MEEVRRPVVLVLAVMLFDHGGLVIQRPHAVEIGRHIGQAQASVEGHVPNARLVLLVITAAEIQGAYGVDGGVLFDLIGRHLELHACPPHRGHPGSNAVGGLLPRFVDDLNRAGAGLLQLKEGQDGWDETVRIPGGQLGLSGTRGGLGLAASASGFQFSSLPWCGR